MQPEHADRVLPLVTVVMLPRQFELLGVLMSEAPAKCGREPEVSDVRYTVTLRC